MNDTKIQWHPGFVAAMDLEFEENRCDLIYEKEYNLNTKPLEIDLLVIKKDPDVQMVNEIGKLKALSDRVQKQEMKELLKRINNLTQKFDKELADSVLEVSIRANKQIIEELRGDDSMCQALLEIMEPEINKIRADDAQKLIFRAVKSFRDLGVDDEQIKKILMKNYELTPKEVAMYLC